MPALFEYLLKANIGLLLFCAGYYLILRRLTFYSLNRVYLICAIVFSAVYPLIDLSSFVEKHQQLSQPIQAVQLVVVNWQRPVKATSAALPKTDWWLLAKSVFLTGVVCMLIRFALQLAGLYRLVNKAKDQTIYNHSIKAVDQHINPFSFWQSIYVNPARHEPEQLKAILAHEQVHITGWHTLDILLAEISLIVYWFNPGVWLIKNAITENIEFITDRAILQQGIDCKQYQYSLLDVALTAGSPAMVNHFNFSKLKKRIIMMNSKASSRINLTRYVFILPLIGVLLFCFTFSKANVAVKARTAINKFAHLVSNNKVNTLLADAKHKLPDLLNQPVIARATDTLKKKSNKNIVVQGQPFKIMISPKDAGTTNLNPELLEDTVAIGALPKKLQISVDTGGMKREFLIQLRRPDAKQQLTRITGIRTTSYSNSAASANSAAVVNDLNSKMKYAIASLSGKVPDTIIVNQSGTTVKLNSSSGSRNFVVVESDQKNVKGKSIINGTDFSNFDNSQHLLLLADEHEISISTLQSLNPNRIGSIAVLNAQQATAKFGKKGKNGALLVTTKTPSYAYTSTFYTPVTKPGTSLFSSPGVKELLESKRGTGTSTYGFKYSPSPNQDKIVIGKKKVDSLFFNKIQSGGTIILEKGIMPSKAKIIINGKPGTYKDYKLISPDSVESVSVIKNNGVGSMLYGDEAKNGVIIITTKKH